MQAAQIIHAAGKSSPGNLPDGTFAIALAAKDEHDLCALAARLKLAGIERHLIIEVDPPYTNQAMAIGIPPMDRRLLKKLLSSYPLLK